MVDDKAIYKHAFWLYGVIIGLAIKEAFETVVPHWIHPTNESQHFQLSLFLEIFRFFTFLFLTVRFYLGSAYYFGLAHEAENAETEFPNRNFATDFVLGFLHFLGFVFAGWAVGVHGEMRLFPLALIFILGYDLAWFVMTRKLDTTDLIKWWAIVNGVVLGFCVLLYLVVERITTNAQLSEICALVVVFVTTLLDIGWMMQKKPFFEPIRNWIVGNRRRQDAPPTAPA